ncbi:hypothetical protein WGC32_14890 [Zongyangia sp. HA2173]|uniref:hypothetical protein n=1 Tax=Zongyangia sp. HA2173 TaxID=3133035 RepID=UPI003169D939
MRMSHRRAIYKGGGIPPVPTSWMTHAVVAATGSWSPTVAGWYQFYVIGQGGNGGSGDRRYSVGSRPANRAVGGGGGGTGGVAVHQLYLTPSNSVSITVGDSQTTLSFDGQTVTATAGSNGGNGAASASSPGAGGAGGTASGGNVSNINGIQGGNGTLNFGRPDEPSLPASGGAGGTPTAEMKYVASAASSGAATGAAAPYSTDVSNPQLGGGASGGGARSKGSAYNGGAGAPGGVVIEAGA